MTLLQNISPLKLTLLVGSLCFGSLIALFIAPTMAYLLFGAALVILALYFARKPLALLASLLVLRMSLDYSAQYFHVSLFGQDLSLSQLLGIGISLLGLGLVTLYRKRLPHFPLLTPFFIIFLWGLSTLLYTISPWTSLYELLRFFDLFVIGFLAWVSVKTPENFQTLLKAVFISSFLPILFGLFQYIFDIGLNDENVSIPRIFGTFSHPNVFSLYLMTVMVLGTMSFIAWAKTARQKLFLIVLQSILLGTLLLTFARIAWIALFVFALLVALYRYRLLLLPLFFLPLVLFALSPTVQERVLEALHPTPDSSITWRQNLWHDVLLKTEYDNREVLGSGMDTFRIVSEDLRGKRFGSNEAHNDFVKFYVEGGLIGFGVFIAYLLSLFAILFEAYRHSGRVENLRISVVLTSFLLAVLVLASFSDNVFKNTPVQWIVWATLGGLLGLIQNKHETKG